MKFFLEIEMSLSSRKEISEKRKYVLLVLKGDAISLVRFLIDYAAIYYL